MIGFDLTQEQKDLRDLVHEFARDVIRPAAPEYDEKEETPWPIMQQAHELGLDTYAVSRGVRRRRRERHGHPDDRHRRADLGLRGHRHRHQRHRPVRHGHPAVRHARTEGQVHADVLRSRAGRAGRDGSDRGRGRLRRVGACGPAAKRVEGGYLLNGSKRFITNGGIADVHVIFATTDPAAGWARHPGVRGRQRQPGPESGQERTQDGRARLAHRRGHPRGLLRARPRTCSAASAAAAASAC